MSLVNLLGNIETQDYQFLYVVRSSVLQEALAEGAIVEGAVGYVQPATSCQNPLPARSTATFPSRAWIVDMKSISFLPEKSSGSIALEEEIGPHDLRSDSSWER
jgi:hypothetical protein